MASKKKVPTTKAEPPTYYAEVTAGDEARVNVYSTVDGEHTEEWLIEISDNGSIYITCRNPERRPAILAEVSNQIKIVTVDANV